MPTSERADLVLSGGGVKGIALAGSVSALINAGYQPHRISGTSAGALVGAVLAAVVHFVARTRDGGETWEALRNGLPQDNAFDVVYRHALANRGQHLCFGSTTGNHYVSEDAGDRFVTVANNLPPIYSVRFG